MTLNNYKPNTSLKKRNKNAIRHTIIATSKLLTRSSSSAGPGFRPVARELSRLPVCANVGIAVLQIYRNEVVSTSSTEGRISRRNGARGAVRGTSGRPGRGEFQSIPDLLKILDYKVFER